MAKFFQENQKVNNQVNIKDCELPCKPECFEFAMGFIGGDEEKEIRAYIERLEKIIAS